MARESFKVASKNYTHRGGLVTLKYILKTPSLSFPSANIYLFVNACTLIKNCVNFYMTLITMLVL